MKSIVTASALLQIRTYEQGTDQHNSRSEKQELRQNNVGRIKARTAKRMDVRQRKNAPHHHRRQIKVNRIRNKDDNGAVHTFARENTQGATDFPPSASLQKFT